MRSTAFRTALDAGDPWFDALMRAIALWESPDETVDGRQYRYLIGGEAFDWLLLAERLLRGAPTSSRSGRGAAAVRGEGAAGRRRERPAA